MTLNQTNLVPVSGPGLPLADLDRTQCRYGVNTPARSEPHLFCSAPVEPGQTYCPCHMRLVWPNGAPKRSAALAAFMPGEKASRLEARWQRPAPDRTPAHLASRGATAVRAFRPDSPLRPEAVRKRAAVAPEAQETGIAQETGDKPVIDAVDKPVVRRLLPEDAYAVRLMRAVADHLTNPQPLSLDGLRRVEAGHGRDVSQALLGLDGAARLALIKAAGFPDPQAEMVPMPQHVVIETMRRRICRLFGLTRAELCSARRAHREVYARQMLSYWLIRRTTKSYPEIGRMLGKRDHTTILHGVRKWPVNRLKAKALLAEERRQAATLAGEEPRPPLAYAGADGTERELRP